MIGKLFIPLAIGGGLMFLLSSSAGAKPAPASHTPFDSLPNSLKQLAGQAQATNDPDMLEQAAAQLDAQGFHESSLVLRQQAIALRLNPFGVLPNNLKQLAGQAQATNDPNTLEQVALQLDAQGFHEPARLLRV